MRSTPLPPAASCALECDDLLNGAFSFPRVGRETLNVIVSDGTAWAAAGMPPPAFEHVSVSTPTRCPTWEEMNFIKSLWWRDDETVIQYHPPRAQHVNYHPYCLHLWKPVGIVLPLPPTLAVGPPGLGLEVACRSCHSLERGKEGWQ